jgi:menaquinone-dependent protoporphyrinogen IX oxidase
MKKILIVGVAVVVLVVLIGSAFATLSFDLISYTATGSETLNPTGKLMGRALVAYNPGFSGAAKQAATKIAEALQAKGYTVDLAGVRSAKAHNATNYDIIVAGGPMYWGKASLSIEEYLKALTLTSQTKLGVFVTTGSSEYASSDFESLQQQVMSATNSRSQVAIKMVLDGNKTPICADLASELQ